MDRADSGIFEELEFYNNLFFFGSDIGAKQLRRRVTLWFLALSDPNVPFIWVLKEKGRIQIIFTGVGFIVY